MKTHIFTVKLLENHLTRRPRVVRDIEVREDSSLYDLAEAILDAYGFDFDHAFGFFNQTGEDYSNSDQKYELFADMEDVAADHPESRSVRRTKVAEVWKILGDTMLFLFDYGDMWRFTVQLTGFGVARAKGEYPKILKKTGNPPEQYPAAEEE